MALSRGDTVTVLLQANDGEVELTRCGSGCLMKFMAQCGVSLTIALTARDAEQLAEAMVEATADDDDDESEATDADA